MDEIQVGNDRFPLRNIYCVGRNYVAHAKELGNDVPEAPIIFLKNPAAARELASKGVLAFAEEEFHYEAELVLLIGDHLNMGTIANEENIVAIGLGIDLTRRGVQDQLKSKGQPWTIAKNFKGSALLGPFVKRESLPDLKDLEFEFKLDDKTKQRGAVASMIWKPVALVNYLLGFNDLYRGDLVFTGTPAGVSTIRAGQSFELNILNSDYCVKGCL